MGTVPLNVSVYPAVPGWAVGGGGTGFSWQSFRSVQRSCTGGSGIYPRSAVYGEEGLISVGTKSPLPPHLEIFFHMFLLPSILTHGVESQVELFVLNV